MIFFFYKTEDIVSLFFTSPFDPGLALPTPPPNPGPNPADFLTVVPWEAYFFRSQLCSLGSCPGPGDKDGASDVFPGCLNLSPGSVTTLIPK